SQSAVLIVVLYFCCSSNSSYSWVPQRCGFMAGGGGSKTMRDFLPLHTGQSFFLPPLSATIRFESSIAILSARRAAPTIAPPTTAAPVIRLSIICSAVSWWEGGTGWLARNPYWRFVGSNCDAFLKFSLACSLA